MSPWWTRDRRDFCFRSRYFRFRPDGKPRSCYPRRQLPWTDSPCTRSGGSYPWIWTGLPLPVGLFPLLVGLRGGAGRRHDNRLASGCNKTRFFHGESAEFTENIQNYAKNGKLATPSDYYAVLMAICDYGLRRFCDTRKWKYQPRNRKRKVLPPAVFQGRAFYPTISTRE